MAKITLTLDGAEAVFLAHTLAAAKDHHAELGLSEETDSDDAHKHLVSFRHAEVISERLDGLARGVVFGW